MANKKKNQATSTNLKKDSKPQGKPLGDKELAQASGGVTFNYSKIKVSY